MIAFIIECWWQIALWALYIIGSVLAWGRIISVISNTVDYKPCPTGIKILLVVLFVVDTWLGFLILWASKQPHEKFFKWLPILLLWCMVAVGCSPNAPKDPLYRIVYAKYYARLDGSYSRPGTQLPVGICYYRISNGHDFEDSCGKYQLEDTVK